MAVKSSVTMIGLTATIASIEGSARKMQPTINDMTRDFMNVHYALYVTNLSGTKPSTSSQPLPVGQVTGDLKRGAEKRQINQFAYEIKNEDFKAAWIEDGTQNMAPRRPLAEATQQLEKQVPGRMGKVVSKVWDA